MLRLLKRVSINSALLSVLLLLAAPALAAPRQAPAADQAPAAEQSWTLVDDDWMTLEIGGGRVGWMNTIVERNGDQVRTRTISQMSIKRGDIAIDIKLNSDFIETTDGKPITVTSVQNMATQAVETKWEFLGDKIKQTITQGGRSTTSELKAPTVEWFPPHAADVFARKQRADGVKEFTLRSLDPQNGIKPITTTSKHVGPAEFDMNGTTISVQEWSSLSDTLPIPAKEYVNDEGDVVYQEIPTGMGKIVMRATTKELAIAEGEGDGAGGPPELMINTFAKPDKPIKDSMKSTTAKLKLTAREGTLPELPTAGAQKVERSADGKSAVLTIDIHHPQSASQADANNDEYTKPSAMLDYEDELVGKLAGKVDEADINARALALRKLVHKHISKKGLATAFANASETARTRSGDCSEHGVLLAALLRADGIPSRVAMGLVYADAFLGEEGIFGWHMWTQALIDGKWVDLDATLPVPYMAAHILTNTSSLADGLGAADMASIMQLIGNIDIEVIEVGYE